MKDLYLVTLDERLYQKLRLLLKDSHSIIRVEKPYRAGLCLVDLDSYGGDASSCVTMSRTAECDIALPPSHARIKEVLSGEEKERKLSLYDSERICKLGEREIRLTEVEYRLLAMLFKSEGYVARETLLLGVWDENTDAGVVNVYIHYLRTKLEGDGEKIILSSRKEGYMLNPKYR